MMSTYDLLAKDFPCLVNIEQLQSITGVKDRTFRHWLQKDRMPIPVVRLGGAIRFRLLDVANWIDGGQETASRRRPGRPRKADQVRQQVA